MTTPDTHPEGSNEKTDSSVSRRSYLAGLTTGPFITAVSSGDTTSGAFRPNKALIAEAQLPEPFTPLSGTDAAGVFDAIQSPGEGSTPRNQVAYNGFWAGNVPEEPLWVAGSSACVGVSSGEITTAAETMSQEYAAFIDEYDAETESSWHFERQYAESETFREWRTGIYIGHYISSEEVFEMTDKPKLIDVFRMQYVNNTLLGTVLFGPTDWDWSHAELLDRLTEYQRDQALSLSGVASTTTSGDK